MMKPEISEAGGPHSGGEACIPNISLVERRKRLAAGVIQFMLSLIILAALMSFGVSRWWRLALLPMFLGASAGYYQWRDNT
jgi:hypothetical protein